jgi:hypothetical protein
MSTNPQASVAPGMEPFAVGDFLGEKRRSALQARAVPHDRRAALLIRSS